MRVSVLSIVDSNDGAILAVKLKPAAGKTALVGEHGDGALKAAVRAAPERGKANAELLDLLASALDLRRAGLEIIGGETSREKRVLFRGLAAEALRARLATVLTGKG